jgi:hypothetical protein
MTNMLVIYIIDSIRFLVKYQPNQATWVVLGRKVEGFRSGGYTEGAVQITRSLSEVSRKWDFMV